MTVVLGLLCVAAAAEAQCRNGSCSAPAFYGNPYPMQFVPLAPAPVQAKAGKLEWRRGAESDQYALYRDGVHVGGYRVSTGEFLPVLADGSWAACWPPCDPPAGIVSAKVKASPCKCGAGCKCGQDPCTCYAAEAKSADWPDFMLNGVDNRELAKETAKGPKYHVKGVEVSREQALAFLESGANLTDDSNRKGCVVCVGGDCEQVAKDWKASPALAKAKESFAFQAYDAKDKLGSLMPKARGYTDGLYVVDKAGHDLTGKGVIAYAGPEQLAKDVDGILNPKAPLIQPKVDLGVPPWLWLAGAGLLGWVLAKREQPKA